MTTTLRREVLFMACIAFAAMARSAAPAPNTVTLGEIDVSGPEDRERERGPLRTVGVNGYAISVTRKHVTGFEVSLAGIRQQQIRFRRQSSARRLAPESESSSPPGLAARMDGDRVVAAGKASLNTVKLIIDDNVDEADGLPASIPFGAHAALVNLDYVRLRYRNREVTSIGLAYGIHPQTRSCLRQFTLLDDGLPSPNRFILLGDSRAACRRAELGREGDLLFAENVPQALRQAVVQTYDPIAAHLASRLGSEPGLVYVASWPDSPHTGLRFENSWNRNSLLLFNGEDWQRGLDEKQRDTLRDAFIAEQIHRRIRYTDWPGDFTESAAIYLVILATGERARNSSRLLAGALPDWIAGCANHLIVRAVSTPSGNGLTGVDCGLLVQFVYDMAARVKSGGHESLYDTWRRLLNESYQRGESGVNPATFLASSREAHRVVRGLLDGTVDWNGFAADLQDLGVSLNLKHGGPVPTVVVQSLAYGWD
jgi:hypothetical protein